MGAIDSAAALSDQSAMLTRMQFSGTWRDYQTRVLAELDSHLSDERLHVVAAPGSGKTVLGLEIMRRLGRPSLVLAPNTTIRDQWPSRLVPLFLTDHPEGEEISCLLEEPGLMTAATYQALHAHWADGTGQGKRFDRLAAALRKIGPVTLILDEAHHLRKEWWNALQALADTLPDAQIVALTATPPYDAPYPEWVRYEAMCGPIDLEISVPELVRNGDLCPHQDHVLFSRPDADALALLDQRRAAIASIQAGLCADHALIDFLLGHGWLTDPIPLAEEILEAPEMLSAILVFLASAGRELPAPPLELLGVGRREVPPPSPFWLETLLNGFLYKWPGIFPIGDERHKALRTELQAQGLIEGGRVRLRESRRLFSLMARSIGKMESIVTIAREEADNLGLDLRMVILSDHVRAGDLDQADAGDYRPTRLGVVPIFETLRRARIEEKLGVLTGGLVILPREAEPALRALVEARGLPPERLMLTPLPACPGHVRLDIIGEGERRIVELVTALFTAGEVTILVGTQALLGEGWDAPAINSLVLASNAGAFMLSNQMRGRAIRIDPQRPGKVSNIWHLATIPDPDGGSIGGFIRRLNWGHLRGAEQDDLTSDLDLLARRFRAFEGIANDPPPRIESGLDRLGLFDVTSLETANERTLAMARDRRAIAERWAVSLGDPEQRSHVHEVATPNHSPRRLSWRNSLYWLGVTALSGGTFALGESLFDVVLGDTFATWLAWTAGAVALATLPKLFKALRLLVRNGSIEGTLRQAGGAVLRGLNRAKIVSDADLANASLVIHRNSAGSHDIAVRGVSRAAERAVLDAISELLGPVENPRYLLVRESWLMKRRRRADYHAVPAAIGKRKEWAEAFHQDWNARVGPSELVPTRTPEGRLQLLKARARSFAAGFQRAVERRSAWL